MTGRNGDDDGDDIAPTQPHVYTVPLSRCVLNVYVKLLHPLLCVPTKYNVFLVTNMALVRHKGNIETQQEIP